MKKYSIALLALASAIAISPVAKADTFNFDFVGQNGSDFVAQGTLDATEIGSSGLWNITSMSGTFMDKDNGLNIVSAPITLYPDGGTAFSINTIQGSINGYYTADGAEGYDNVLYILRALLILRVITTLTQLVVFSFTLAHKMLPGPEITKFQSRRDPMTVTHILGG